MANTAYQSTHTGAQIDNAVTKVLTTGEIAKMVRDEVKAQLSAITTGAASVPVFDSTQIMKLISISNFAKAVDGLPPITGEETDMDNYTTPGIYVINNTAGQVAHCPYQGNVRLKVEYFTGTYSFLQTIHTYVNDVGVFIRRRSYSAWGGWVELAKK